MFGHPNLMSFESSGLNPHLNLSIDFDGGRISLLKIYLSWLFLLSEYLNLKIMLQADDDAVFQICKANAFWMQSENLLAAFLLEKSVSVYTGYITLGSTVYTLQYCWPQMFKNHVRLTKTHEIGFKIMKLYKN